MTRRGLPGSVKSVPSVVVLSDRLPFPVHGGDRLRIYRICRHLTRRGFRVHLVCFSRDPADAERIRRAPERDAFEEIRAVPLNVARAVRGTIQALICREPLQVGLYRSAEYSTLLREVLGRVNPDSVLVHLARMAPFAPPRIGRRRILDLCDVNSAFYRDARRLGGLRSVLYTFEECRMRRFEREWARRFEHVVVVSERERRRLREIGVPPGRIRVIPNGVREEWLSLRTKPEPGRILFHGNHAYPPNADAAWFFARRILPEIPGATFRVVGPSPPRRLAGLPRVEVTGPVERLEEELQRAAVLVAPLRVASGIQNKVLDALALGVPVVATSPAVGGIEGIPGRHFLVADGPRAMVRAVRELLESPARRQALSRNGRELVRKRYLWPTVLAPYESLLQAR